MNRLEQLIKELCPNGVEYKKLGDVALYSQISSDKFFLYNIIRKRSKNATWR